MIVYPRNKLLPGHIEVLWKKQLDDRDLGGKLSVYVLGCCQQLPVQLSGTSAKLLIWWSGVRSPSSVLRREIQLKEQKQIWFKPFFRSIISVVKNARLIFFKVSVRHQFDSGMEHLEGDTAQGALCRLEPTTKQFDCLRETIRRVWVRTHDKPVVCHL